MRIESVRVNDSQNVLTLLIKSFILLIIGVASIVVDLNILFWLKPLNVHLIILIFVGVAVVPTAFFTWLLSIGEKAKVTPILHVEGTAFSMSGTPESHHSIGTIFFRPEEKPACIKFSLCEEGIVLYRAGYTGLVRWDNIHELKANHENKSFELIIKRTMARDSFFAQDRFDEVRQMLSERISIN